MNGIGKLIHGHGGPTKIAKGCGCRSQRISMWITRNSIPIRHWPDLHGLGITFEELVKAHLENDDDEIAA
jgi:hypothetical protein